MNIVYDGIVLKVRSLGLRNRVNFVSLVAGGYMQIIFFPLILAVESTS